MLIRAARHLIVTAIFLLSFSTYADEAPVILVLGDSLSAGYGIDVKAGWVALLQQRLNDQYPHQVINASVSGETAGGGLARLPALLQEHQPSLVVLELGGNDGLRGHPVNIMQQQLDAIIQKSLAAKAKVLLLGMQIPPNYGQRYTQHFHQAYSQLAEQYKLPYVPFFLEGIAVNAELMQRDGIHPTAQAQPQMLDNLWQTLEPLLKPDR